MTEISTVAKEIERKYLLSALPKDLAKYAIAKFRTNHGWILGDVIQERITFSGREDKFWRVIKTGKGIERIEAQEEISLDLFAALWPLTRRRISKIRYNVPFNDGKYDLIWEIDDFLDQRLQLAEIEIPSVDYKVTIPAWMQPYLLKEVTEDPAYLNINLAEAK